jgi:hypothetical protein
MLPREMLWDEGQPTTLVVIVELSLSSWLVTGLVANPSRQPLKKLRCGVARAKTGRLDAELPVRAVLGWLRGERKRS